MSGSRKGSIRSVTSSYDQFLCCEFDLCDSLFALAIPLHIRHKLLHFPEKYLRLSCKKTFVEVTFVRYLLGLVVSLLDVWSTVLMSS
jgi:hypothetical protein